MPVVSNTSPLLNLAIIDHLFLLTQQFGQVLIPQSVGNGALVSLLRQQLHQGESEAIALAIEVSAERILLDEKEARQSARALGLAITGILGILLRGWHEGTVDSMKVATERLQREANFWIALALLNQLLQESGELD
jgi:predicted nucleic acid-binding protein